MAEIDAEVVERVRRWCAEAGRQAATAEIRSALAPLGWDELLAVKALLADPPPARPLGPHALADLARGTPADVAAEREREGRYAHERDATGAAAAAPADEEPGALPRAAPRRRAASRRPAQIVVHRARDRVAAPPPAPPPPPPLDALRAPEGRAVLERLLRERGARRAELARALAAWRRPDGAAPGEDDLAALLEHHGLARAFERRERDELLHAVRAAGGVRTRAAARVGLDAAGLAAALARLGATGDAERVREERRRELRARGTLSERVHLVLDDPERLADLGIAEEFEADLRARLPEHVRALARSGGPVAAALAASLSVRPEAIEALAARLGVPLREGADAPRRRGPAPSPPPRDRAGAPPRADRRRRGGPRPAGGARPAGSPKPPARGAQRGPRGPRRTPARPRGRGR